MRRRLLIALLPVAGLLFSSCGAWYLSKPVDVPLLEGGGDVRVSVSVSTFDIVPAAINGAVSYGITDHIGAQAFGALSGSEDYYGHLAGGWYTSLSDHLVLELFGGFGVGRSMNDGAAEFDNLEATPATAVWFDYRQLFGQVDVGWHGLTKANIDLGAGLRGGAMPYALRVIDKSRVTLYDGERGTLPFFEPLAFVRIGFKAVKVQFSAGYNSLDLFREQLHDHVECSPLTLSLGLSLNL